jgi:hypothetical protein
MIATGGYVYELNYDIVLTPTVLVRTDFVSYSFDIGVSRHLQGEVLGRAVIQAVGGSGGLDGS